MTTMTLQQVLQAYGPKGTGQDSIKRRDPIERELLIRTGDKQVQREDPSRIRKAGARPKP